MIYLNEIKATELKSTPGFEEIFPFSLQYLNNAEFCQSKYEWYYITDDQFNDPKERETWLAIICVTEDKYIYGDNLHLSVIEVAEPLQGLYIGTKVIDKLIDVARQNQYTTLTLHIKDKKLESFYKRFGFEEVRNDGGMTFHQLEL